MSILDAVASCLLALAIYDAAGVITSRIRYAIERKRGQQ